MKIKTILAAVLAVILIIISCSKKQKNDLQISNTNTKELKISFSDISSNQNSSQKILPPDYEDPSGGCSCSSHGGTAAFSLTWVIATCRSDCSKGLGFRCGREGFLLCRDGSSVICVAGANCPNNNTRTMRAELTFYTNNTVKLIFLNAVPSDELSNTTFEVEQTEFVDLPPGMKLDGIHYSGFNTHAGNYTINYSDGQFGSVIINAQLQL